MNVQQQPERLQQENQQFSGTSGISQENGHLNFIPAFMDELSGVVEASRFRSGMPAPFHSLEGLPDIWVKERDETDRVVQIKNTIISGFVRLGQFFTREEAAAFVELGGAEQSFS